MNATATSTRRYDFDWLRVLLILSVFVFHTLRIYDVETWHIKSSTTYQGVQLMVVFISRWLMPAIFVISGAAVYFALGKRGAGSFIRERAQRLLEPLLVGLFTHLPVQGYIEAVTHTGYSGGFWQYYAGMFSKGGNFNWIGNHLWYLEALFVFSLILLPLLIWLRRGSGQRLLDSAGRLFAKPGAIYLLALPTLALLFFINPYGHWLVAGENWGGWNLPNHMVFFLGGFILGSSLEMQSSIRRLRWVSLVGGVVTLAAGVTMLVTLGEPRFGTGMHKLIQLFNGLTVWCWVYAILGFGMQKLNHSMRALDYANDAVMPVYVMHQSVIVVVGYFVMRWGLPDLLEWAIVLAGSLMVVIGLYELVIRRVNVMRVLFGLKPLRKTAAVNRQPAREAA